MVKLTRARLARLCIVVAALALLLPWERLDSGTNLGIQADEGWLILLACFVTLGLLQVGFRPAWVGVGFAAAVSGRALVSLSGAGMPDVGVGLIVVFLASLVAAALLLYDLFASVSRAKTGEA